MKRPIPFALIVSLSFSFSLLSQPKQRCGADLHRQLCHFENPELIQKQKALEIYTRQWIRENTGALRSREIITIPVVVHVLWNKPEQNIPNEQIESQIEALNEDFRAMNVEIDEVPPEFQNAIADTEIEFCLAKRDPNGNPTDGITRTFTETAAMLGSKSIHYAAQGGADAWDSDRYLNIWVANSGSIAGFGSFPGDDPPEEDGIEIADSNFGTILLAPPYHLGRTATHEIGHYFNLFHVWGDNCADDEVNDTPLSSVSYLGQCPTHPVSSCGSNDMFMNFLYWTDDACMAMFTLGQKMRMMATLEGPRSGLLSSKGCLPVGTSEPEKALDIRIFPNPVSEVLNIEFESPILFFPTEIGIWNALGQKIIDVAISSKSDLQINVSNLPGGVYFLKMEGEGVVLTTKFIKDR